MPIAALLSVGPRLAANCSAARAVRLALQRLTDLEKGVPRQLIRRTPRRHRAIRANRNLDVRVRREAAQIFRRSYISTARTSLTTKAAIKITKELNIFVQCQSLLLL